MRKYKKLIIPNRHKRTDEDILHKQMNYCDKSDCDDNCVGCLFGLDNTEVFTEWYMAKNKKDKQQGE